MDCHGIFCILLDNYNNNHIMNILTAKEAFKLCCAPRQIRIDKELIAIMHKIKPACELGELKISMKYFILSETKHKLYDLGYRVEETHNPETRTIISWGDAD